MIFNAFDLHILFSFTKLNFNQTYLRA